MSILTKNGVFKNEKAKQWLWFLGLWLGGLLTVSALGYLIKFLMAQI